MHGAAHKAQYPAAIVLNKHNLMQQSLVLNCLRELRVEREEWRELSLINPLKR